MEASTFQDICKSLYQQIEISLCKPKQLSMCSALSSLCLLKTMFCFRDDFATGSNFYLKRASDYAAVC